MRLRSSPSGTMRARNRSTWTDTAREGRARSYLSTEGSLRRPPQCAAHCPVGRTAAATAEGLPASPLAAEQQPAPGVVRPGARCRKARQAEWQSAVSTASRSRGRPFGVLARKRTPRSPGAGGASCEGCGQVAVRGRSRSPVRPGTRRRGCDAVSSHVPSVCTAPSRCVSSRLQWPTRLEYVCVSRLLLPAAAAVSR